MELYKSFEVVTRKAYDIEEYFLKQSEFSELSLSQIHHLEAINELINPTVSELARKLELSKPTVTIMLDKLVDKGYVIKIRSDEDRRSAHVHLTEKGNKLKDLHDQIHKKLAEIITKGLNEQEVEILKIIMEKSVSSFVTAEI